MGETLLSISAKRPFQNLQVMLYVLTCAFVDYFARLLPKLPRLSHISFDSLHGKMVQKRRRSVSNLLLIQS
jgi:superfamily II DNA/RNA helicase